VQLHQVRLAGGRQLGRLALQLSLGPRDSHAFAGAHPEQVDLELGEDGQHLEEHLAHRVGGVTALLTSVTTPQDTSTS
jgi:hypothetical protein